MKFDISKFAKAALAGTKEHMPEILIAVGTSGLIGAIFMGAKATAKACPIIEETKLDLDKDELTKTEVVKAAWKCYIPTALMATSGVVCIVAGTTKNLRKSAALATAYQLSQETLEIYKQKVVETIGEKKERVIQEEVAKEKYDRRDRNQPIIVTPHGETNCYDPVIKKRYKSSLTKVENSINKVNNIIKNEMSANYNDYLEQMQMGAYPTFDDIGWDIDDFPVDLIKSYGPDDAGEPCLITEFSPPPHALLSHSYR